MQSKKIEKTKSARKLFIGIGLLVAGIGLFIYGIQGVTDNRVVVKTPKQLIHAEVADQEAVRQRGLSGRKSLGKDSAMLFVFSSDAKYGIWMKEMNFSIDIVWLDKDKKVVTIEENVSPDTFPKVFAPTELSRYVIELPAGRAGELGISPGTVLSWR